MKKRRFKHLSWTDRLKIETMLKDKRHKQEIADEIGVHLKTIYNEIKRGRYIHTNSDLTEEERYSPEMAEAAYREHLAAKGPDLKIGDDHELAQYIEKKIAEEGYSPAGTSIENRPKEIDDRAVVGDWEMDCVEGKKKTKKTLLVLTERKSRREIIRPMRDQTARSVVRALDSLEREYGANFSKIFRTITVDNGSEFADCAGMEKSCRRKGNRTKIYYCHPYSSYERGSNENVNKMIRRWFPKGTDFRKITAKAIQKVEDWINNYPREILGFRTAEEVFQEGVASLI